MYSTIIFDVDGTLIDTEEAVLGSLQKLLKTDYNKEVDLSELIFVLGIPGTVSLPKLGIDNIDKANERWNFFMKDFYHSIHVFNGINNLMDTLKNKGIVQGIVTSKTKEELQDDFVPFGLMKYLTYIVCADDTNKHKPNPEPILKFLENSKAEPSSSIYIGDTIYDSECARDSGVDFGLALWGCKNHENIPAKYKFETPLDILKILV
ncbi:HAD family hydrolase [Paenibacillus aceris]|uniref:Phosphoglycolate phosphatase-like HAD superfamily hydrolase n=1 Tax=Paenibacillus aceris TaxID=869555 RepID=A0ABS4I160_9BACL|nr:HAD family hydrolase [Paenibacillus aceris]MBP1964161.1 phosphoglycolate phosphatase-like HAD superfamily hydrolase [Paenibacillus aceris]NHW36491.1 HAD family hydrolase [Paenibacillus aceris]